MLRNLILSAAGAGIVVCVALTALQAFTTEPLILHAEEFEGAAEAPAPTAVAHEHDAATPAHDEAAAAAAHHHDEDAWAPADGFERTAYTVLANFVIGVGVSLILISVMVLTGRPIDAAHGLLFGAAGFIAISLLPSLGLPPELPGTPAADIVQRQIWWLATAAVSAIGIGLIAFGAQWPLKAVGLALLVAPHVVGAPVPPSHDVAYPGALAGEFVIASLVVSAVLWLLSGAMAGWLHQRLSRSG